MDFNLHTDKDVIRELGDRYEKIRLKKGLSDEDVSKKGGATIAAIQRLKSGENINLVNFIKILRGLGEINRLDKLLVIEDDFSIREKVKKSTPKRVFKSKKSNDNNDFVWGDDK